MRLQTVTAAYLLVLIPLMLFDIDWQLASYLYDLEGQQWLFRHHWFFQGVLHDLAHDLVVAFYLLILMAYIGSRYLTRLANYRRPLAYLSLSLPIATLSVSLIKRLTFVDCPWSIIDFSGQRPYQTWFHSLIEPISGAGHCFPAAHASSAYMLFGVYFVAREYFPQYAKQVLLAIIGLGLLFGLAQQLRGAHFISHDITSAFICWVMTALLWRYFSVGKYSTKCAIQSEQA